MLLIKSLCRYATKLQLHHIHIEVLIMTMRCKCRSIKWCWCFIQTVHGDKSPCTVCFQINHCATVAIKETVGVELAVVWIMMMRNTFFLNIWSIWFWLNPSLIIFPHWFNRRQKAVVHLVSKSWSTSTPFCPRWQKSRIKSMQIKWTIT